MFLTAGDAFIAFPRRQHVSWRLPVRECWYRHLHILHTVEEITAHSLFAAHDYNCCQWNSLCRSSLNCLDPWAELADTHHLMHFWQTNQCEGQSLPSTQLGLKLSLLTIHITEVFKLIWHVKWMHTNCCVVQTKIHKSSWALMTSA